MGCGSERDAANRCINVFIKWGCGSGRDAANRCINVFIKWGCGSGREAANRCINVFIKCLIQIVTIHMGRSKKGNQYCLLTSIGCISLDLQ